jgi:hypothetical protein
MPADTRASEASPVAADLASALTFHAGFDHGSDADFGSGDHQIYTAEVREDQHIVGLTPGLGSPPVAVVDGRGRFGAALEFTSDVSHVLAYKAEGNIAYSSGEFSGTASFWLSLDPAAIPGRYSDPFQLTDKKFSDACIWVDFTKNDQPSDFRLGVFGDLSAWDATGREAGGEDFYHRLSKIAEPPFAAGQWTHVAITWAGINTPQHGRARLYFNGEYRGATGAIREPFTWDMASTTIRLGMGHFVGLVDDLALFNRALTAAEIRQLYSLPGGVAELHR